jgi:hypothetical protein
MDPRVDHVIKALIFIDARVWVRGNDVAMGCPSAHLPGSGIRAPSPPATKSSSTY